MIKPMDTWPIRQKVMWPNHPIDFVKLPEDEWGKHFSLQANGRIVSIVSLFEKEGEAQFRKFATLQEEQGKGYGSYLLNKVIESAANNGNKFIWCNARKDKASFYERFRMEKTDKTYLKEGIEFVIMKRSF